MSLEKIELLGICASPRKGNSLFLLKKAVESVKRFSAAGRVSVAMLELRSYKIAPCRSCEACAETKGECVTRDGFQEVRDRWVQADVLLHRSEYILTAPAYILERQPE